MLHTATVNIQECRIYNTFGTSYNFSVCVGNEFVAVEDVGMGGGKRMEYAFKDGGRAEGIACIEEEAIVPLSQCNAFVLRVVDTLVLFADIAHICGLEIIGGAIRRGSVDDNLLVVLECLLSDRGDGALQP